MALKVKNSIQVAQITKVEVFDESMKACEFGVRELLRELWPDRRTRPI